MPTNSEKNDLERIREENYRLKAAVEELSIINEISTAINSTLSLDNIIELIVQKCVKHIHAEQGTVTLLEKDEANNPCKTLVRKAYRNTGIIPIHLDTQIIGEIIVKRKPILINDLSSHPGLRGTAQDGNPIRSLLSAPLLLKGNVIGSLNIFNKRADSGFTDGDRRLLSIIATQSAQVIENARLYEEEQALIHMREEMHMAFKIQTGLLPESAPEIQGYDIAGRSIPAKSVGGDYYDFIRLDGNRLVSCLGDVSGKGMPAALLMSNLQATFRGQDLANMRPEKIMEKSNSLLFRSTGPDKFATFFFGILDCASHVFDYCNAGHNSPILITGKDARRLETAGLVLGALEDSRYSSGRIDFRKDDILIVFSDGISEALNRNDEEFGEDRICGLVMSSRSSPARDIIDTIMKEVETHAEGLPQMDDMTLVVVKRLG